MSPLILDQRSGFPSLSHSRGSPTAGPDGATKRSAAAHAVAGGARESPNHADMELPEETRLSGRRAVTKSCYGEKSHNAHDDSLMMIRAGPRRRGRRTAPHPPLTSLWGAYYDLCFSSGPASALKGTVCTRQPVTGGVGSSPGCVPGLTFRRTGGFLDANPKRVKKYLII